MTAEECQIGFDEIDVNRDGGDHTSTSSWSGGVNALERGDVTHDSWIIRRAYHATRIRVSSSGSFEK